MPYIQFIMDSEPTIPATPVSHATAQKIYLLGFNDQTECSSVGPFDVIIKIWYGIIINDAIFDRDDAATTNSELPEMTQLLCQHARDANYLGEDGEYYDSDPSYSSDMPCPELFADGRWRQLMAEIISSRSDYGSYVLYDTDMKTGQITPTPRSEIVKLLTST